VGEVYRWLRNILGNATTQQAESSLQHQVDASILTPIRPKDGGQRGHLRGSGGENNFLIGKGFSPRLVELTSGRSKPQVHQQHHPGDDDTQAERRT
jgi:hypothetical protein